MRIDRRSMPTSRDILAVLFRRRWLLLTTFAVVVIGVALSGAWIPEYEAHLKLLVRRQRADPIITPWSSGSSPVRWRPGKRGGSQFHSRIAQE